jgi:hypothetical protein
MQPEELTAEQKLTRALATIETYKHVREVRENMRKFINDLLSRSLKHDDSKFESPEAEIFGDNTHLLAQTEYGSPEYHALLEKVKPAIEHHYAKNRHHPEHHPKGVNDMTLIDLVEMLADWKAATARNKNGNIRKSIEINAKRYNMDAQLKQIFENTVREYFTE